ncbi:hypothetical protein ACWGID_07670 [Kribbella sp. NPDC054772]
MEAGLILGRGVDAQELHHVTRLSNCYAMRFVPIRPDLMPSYLELRSPQE